MRHRETGGGRRQRIRVRLTRTGRNGLLATMIVAGAAVNTANNLLYLFLVLLVALYPLSWFLARGSLRRVGSRFLLPRTLRAETPGSGVVRLGSRAHKRRAAAIVARIDAGAGTSRAAWSSLEPGQEEGREVALLPQRRGLWSVGGQLLCPYPFGLIEARRSLSPAEVLVLPAPLRGHEEPRGGGGARGEEVVLKKGRGSELLNIREYRPGEDARYLDWKATARAQQPMIRETMREGERRAAVIVDPGLPPGCPREEAEAAVERAISRAAGALEALERKGWSLRLVTPEGVTGSGLTAQLESLALLSYAESPWPERHWRDVLEPGEAWVGFSGAEERRRMAS